MPIPASTIATSTPSVLSAGGTNLVLNGVVVSQYSLLPFGAPVSFPNALAVSNYFGPNSVEYQIAQVYFSGYTLGTATPSALLFVRWAQAAIGAFLLGTTAPSTLAQLQAVIPAVTTASAGAAFTGTATGASLAVTAVTGVIHIGDTVSGTGITAGTTILSQSSGTTGGAGTYILSAMSTATAASITATSTVLDVTVVSSGVVAVGNLVTGTGVTAGTRITAQLSGTTGGVGTYQISALQEFASTAVTVAYDLNIAIDGTLLTAASLNLSSAVSFSSAANIIGTALGLSGGQTLVYNSMYQAFVVSSGTTGSTSSIAIATGGATALLGLGVGATVSQGSALQTPSALMNALIAVTTNWASFMTTIEPNLATKTLFSAWTSAQNGQFKYVCWDSDSTAATINNNPNCYGQILKTAGYTGTALIGAAAGLSANLVLVAAFNLGVTASLNFQQFNGRATFKFLINQNVQPTCEDATSYANLLSNYYNCYGQFATANEQFNFYTPGSISGNYVWDDAYTNAIWLAGALQVAIMVGFTNRPSFPYNAQGYSYVEADVADPIETAFDFGMIRSGVQLSAQQISEVNAAAGTPIDNVLFAQGWYFKVFPASPAQRTARLPPPCTLWYTDGGSIQALNIGTVDIQ